MSIIPSRAKSAASCTRSHAAAAMFATAGRARGTGWGDDFDATGHLSRSVFDEVGGLDETIFYGPEDVDFCLRVKAAGHRVVQVGGVEVRHPPRRANRKPLTARGLKHGITIVRHLWRHRGAGRR